MELYSARCGKCTYLERALRSGEEIAAEDDERRDPLYACAGCRRVFFLHRRRPSPDELALELRELDEAFAAFGAADPRGRLAWRRKEARSKVAVAPSPRAARCAHCRSGDVRLVAVSEVRARPPSCPACEAEALGIVLAGFGGQ